MFKRIALTVLGGAVVLSCLPCQTATNVDAQHYKLEIEVLFGSKTVKGTNTATFKSLVNGLKSLDLDLTTALQVNGVTMGGKPVTFSRPTNLVRITLDKTYNKDQSFTVAVSYSGTPGRGGFGGFVFTQHGSFSNRTDLAWTLSEPWNARLWWPTKDSPDDKATAEIWVTTPDSLTAVSNGLLQGTDTLSSNRKRFRWKTTYQMAPYLLAISVTDYRKRVDKYTHLSANMPVEFYVFPESWNSWQSGLNLIVPMLQVFSDVYGQYPFVNEKYGIVQFTFSGGMEHQTITGQSSVSGWLSAHELAHQWWGDMITCATWKDIWLNEGFATFSEALWEERKAGGSVAAYHSRMRYRKPRSSSGTVYVYNPTSTSTIFNGTNVYQKGAWVVHQLRHVLGDTAFFKALLDYRKTYSGQSVTTAQFQQSVEQSTGMKLDWFFDQWVYKGGAPVYSYAWKNARQGNQDYLYLQIEQTQTSRPVFIMPMDVRVTTSTGTKTYVVWDDERKDQFAVAIDAPATSVQLDPDQWILRGSNSIFTGSYQQPHFAVDTREIDVVKGGRSGLHMDLGAANKNRPYVMFAGASGSSPGTPLGTVTVPINIDPVTLIVYQLVNTSFFANFAANLDGQGTAMATLNVPANLAVSAKGTDLTFAFVLADRVDFASRPVVVKLK